MQEIKLPKVGQKIILKSKSNPFKPPIEARIVSTNDGVKIIKENTGKEIIFSYTVKTWSVGQVLDWACDHYHVFLPDDETI